MKHSLFPFILALVLFLVGCSSVSTAGATSPTSSTSTCTPFPVGSGPYTYVAIGASDAVGIGAGCPATQGYVPLLGLRMPTHTHVVNLGIAGATVSIAQTNELSAAIAAKPNLITVWLAANDFRAMESGTLTLATYTQNLDQLLASLHSNTTAHVYVANLPDLTKLPYFIHGTVPIATVGAQTLAWNTAIAGVVAKNGDTLVDLHASDLANHPEYIWIDGFHPSTKGYVVLANTFWAVIQAHGDPKS
jgi:lysophospholipase L1-like esterase